MLTIASNLPHTKLLLLSILMQNVNKNHDHTCLYEVIFLILARRVGPGEDQRVVEETDAERPRRVSSSENEGKREEKTG